MIEIENDLTAVMNEEFDKGNFVILQFTSELCDACSALEMELEDVEEDHEDVSILSIDVSENESAVEYYDVYQTPTMVIFNNNREVLFNGTGVMLSQDIEKLLGK